MRRLIRNGTVVGESGCAQADVLLHGQRIERVGRSLAVSRGVEVTDAAGCMVLPGGIDPHVHAWLPLKHGEAKSDYPNVSRAALLGGTTCFFDFVSPEPSEDPRDALARWRGRAESRSACDYAWHLAVTGWRRETEAALREAVRRGIGSFKFYLAYKGALSLDDESLMKALDLARALGVLPLAHCENAEAIAWLEDRLIRAGRRAPRWHAVAHPPSVEADGTHHFLTFTELAGTPAYIVHLSCRQALEIADRFRARGHRVFVETTPQYLLLDRRRADQPGWGGARFVCAPPLRSADDRKALWHALGTGRVDAVGTDHAPFDFKGQKSLGRHDFRLIPGGLPGVRHRLDLLHTEGVRRGRLDWPTFVRVVSTQPARLLGLFPRKGILRAGSDADVVIYDPSVKRVLPPIDDAMNTDYDPYSGWKVRGQARDVFVRGEPVVLDGRFVGPPDHGRFVPARRRVSRATA